MTMFNSEWRRKAVVTLLRIEGISILALGLFLIIKGLVDGGGIEWFVISGILALAIVGGLGLLLAAKGFKSKKMYGRAPAVLANLIALGVVTYMLQAQLWFVAAGLALLALTTLVATLRAIPTDI